MKEHADWTLLGKYIFGECTEEERAIVDEWLTSDPANARLMQDLQRIWKASDASRRIVDADSAWKQLHDRIQTHERIMRFRRDRSPLSSSRNHMRVSKIRFTRLLLGGFALVVCTLVLMLQPWKSDPMQVADQLDKTVSTRAGQRANIELSDGTTVLLNVDSELTFPAEFAIDRREVVLSGEAFFDVSENEEKPFIIRTEKGSIRVLGTAFGIRAYSEESELTVAVTEGVVALQPQAAPELDTLVLRAHDLGTIESDSVLYVERKVDLDAVLAWKNNELRFRNASFDYVTSELERWYALEIEVALNPDSVIPLNATFTDESVGAILTTISEALDINYERNRRKITFYR